MALRIILWRFPVCGTLFLWIMIQNLFANINGFVIDNEIVGKPQIQCGDDGIAFTVQTKNPFRGNVYVRGQFGIPRCRKEFYNNDMAAAGFAVSMGDCGMSKMRTLSPPGMNYNIVVMVSFHPHFVTQVDRAFNIRCFYTQAESPVATDLQVGEPTPFSIEATNVQYPNCLYTMRAETLEGPIARTVQVGDIIVHRWECNNPNYGMLVKNCVVLDGGADNRQLLDERGCPTVTSVIQSPLMYDKSLQLAFASVPAFTFPDRSLMNFRCQIQVCNKAEGECLGLTPPNCPGINSGNYEPGSIVNSNVDPTQVVGTFAPGTYAPFGQPAPTGYPSAGPSPGYGGGFPQPTPVQQQFLGNVYPSPNNPGAGPFPRPYATKRMSPTIDSENNGTAPSFIVLPRHTSRPLADPVDVFHQVDDSKERSSQQSQSKSARARRAEAETMDVEATPMIIFPKEGLGDEDDTHSTIGRRPVIIEEKISYCVHRGGLIALAVFLAMMSVFTIAMSAYVFNDVILKRNRCKMSLITTRRDSLSNIDNLNHVRFSRRDDPFDAPSSVQTNNVRSDPNPTTQADGNTFSMNFARIRSIYDR
ncbi:zona pellucida-like domain-containing protein [Ditylenchus destructor]|nr:zona pellucida-like domain-containing protein [Ditylenchus destructor]